jgi:hypothetical protein
MIEYKTGDILAEDAEALGSSRRHQIRLAWTVLAERGWLAA